MPPMTNRTAQAEKRGAGPGHDAPASAGHGLQHEAHKRRCRRRGRRHISPLHRPPSAPSPSHTPTHPRAPFWQTESFHARQRRSCSGVQGRKETKPAAAGCSPRAGRSSAMGRSEAMTCDAVAANCLQTGCCATRRRCVVEGRRQTDHAEAAFAQRRRERRQERERERARERERRARESERARLLLRWLP
jgi:hypothetical protein